jgi:hypothetical protein
MNHHDFIWHLSVALSLHSTSTIHNECARMCRAVQLPARRQESKSNRNIGEGLEPEPGTLELRLL